MNVVFFAMGMPWRVYTENVSGEDCSKDLYRWYCVTYVIDDAEVKALTTLPAIYKYVKSKYKSIDRAVAIVQDSAFSKFQSVDRYDDVERVVEEMYRGFLSSQKVDNQKIDSVPKVIVSPSVGRFLNKYQGSGNKVIDVRVDICGEASDFRIYLYLKLAKVMLEVVDKAIEKRDKNLIVHLDLSHGVNYVPTLLRTVVQDLLSLVAVYGGFEKVKLVVYNSEPVTSEETGDAYRIHIIDEVALKDGGNFYVTPLLEGVKQLRLFKVTKHCIEGRNLESVGRELGEESSRISKSLKLDEESVYRINVFVGSLVNGLPLLALETMPETSLDQFINEVLKAFKKFIIVNSGFGERGGHILRISRLAALKEPVKALTKILLAKELIAKRFMQRYDRDEDIELGSLEKTAGELYGWSSRLSTVINFDIHVITEGLGKYLERYSEKDIAGEWIQLAKVLKSKPEEEQEKEQNCDEELEELKQRGGDRFKRNFLQHSGLHRCITMVKAESEKVYRIKYAEKVTEDEQRNKEAWSKIYNIAAEGIVKVK